MKKRETGRDTKRLKKIQYFEGLRNTPPQCPHGYNIPTRYSMSSLDGFKGPKSLIDKCRAFWHGSMLLTGKPGCGKTHLGAAVMMNTHTKDWQYFCDQQISKINDGEDPAKDFNSRKLFITVPELLMEIRSSFNDDTDYTEMDMVEKYSSVPFLVLDDLGSEKTTEYAVTTLYLIIDNRYSWIKNTIITTNLTAAEIGEKLSERIASRLNSYQLVRIDLPDYRKGK